MRKVGAAVVNLSMSKALCPFKCLGLIPTIHIDSQELTQRFYLLQQAVHPDRFVKSSVAEKAIAAEKSSEINAAYQCLQHPVERLWAFLATKGIPVDRASNINNNPALVAQVFELQEQALGLSTQKERQGFLQQLQMQMADEIKNFENLLEDQKTEQAITILHLLTYLYKLIREIETHVRTA